MKVVFSIIYIFIMGVSMYDHVIFDVDGTLIDTGFVTLSSLQRVLKEELNRDFEIEELAFALGSTSKGTFDILGIKNADEYILKWYKYFLDMRDKVKVFVGIE